MLDDLITRATLEDLAGTTAFRRGEEYFSVGAVGRLRAAEDKITARVEGTEAYQVELCDDDGNLAYDCTCPRAADGYFCKHCVAVGLAWLAENSAVPKSGATLGKRKRRDPWRDIKEYLTTQPREALIDLLLDVAQRDDRLYQSLLLKAARTNDGGNVATAFRRANDDATRIHSFLDWREIGGFAGGIGHVVDQLAELLKPETAAMLIGLAEYAIERVENSLEHVDDSNGEIGDIVYRLGELHLEACTMTRPDPAGLAERLFRFETTLPFDLCNFDATTYRNALGEEGCVAIGNWRKLNGASSSPGTRRTATILTGHLSPASWSAWQRRMATSRNWWQSSHGISHPAIVISTLLKYGLRLSSRTRRWSGPNAAWRLSLIGQTTDCGIFW